MYKSIFMFEKYLTRVSNDSDRSNLARFRTSCLYYLLSMVDILPQKLLLQRGFANNV